MKKLLVFILLCVGLITIGCAQEENTEGINSALSQFADNVTVDSSEGEVDALPDYEKVLLDTLGEAYLEGRAFMRAEDEEILGELCAVFKIGTNTEERFTTEEWIAVSANSQLYRYDVALDEWALFTGGSDDVVETSSVSIENCIYALNEIYSDEFSAEYYDSNDMIKQAVYESEASYNNYDAPAMLIGLNEAIPSGYFADPTTASYMPVYSFKSKAEISEHFSLYFTQNYINNLQPSIDRNFLEFDGELYLVRGGMGYGVYSVNFDTIDYSNMQDNTLLIDVLFLGNPDGKTRVKFTEENGALKIDSDNYLLMYDLFYVDESWAHIEVPDFLAFTSDNTLPTAPDLFEQSETQEDTYKITYNGDYYELLAEYVKLLEMLEFNIVMDGYEGFYSAEKYEGDYTLTVNAYIHNEDNGITVELTKQQAEG